MSRKVRKKRPKKPKTAIFGIRLSAEALDELQLAANTLPLRDRGNLSKFIRDAALEAARKRSGNRW